MQINAKTPEEYIANIPGNRKQAVNELRKILLENLPEGFTEVIGYGMIGYVVPHSLYPKGYHANPKLPLPFINLASQKNHIALYYMGFADKKLLAWFTGEYAKQSKHKPDMGKGCIRFKNPDDIPYKLIRELASRLSVKDWISSYETFLKR
jgi:hypothetical protein